VEPIYDIAQANLKIRQSANSVREIFESKGSASKSLPLRISLQALFLQAGSKYLAYSNDGVVFKSGEKNTKAMALVYLMPHSWPFNSLYRIHETPLLMNTRTQKPPSVAIGGQGNHGVPQKF
jgi:hypothetical protein